MRVLLVNDYPPGEGFGAEVHLGLLREGLAAAGDTVEAFWGAPHAGWKRVLDLWDPTARRRLAQVSGRFRPDVIHFHNVMRELSPSVFTATDRAARVLSVHDHRILGVPDGPLGHPSDPPPLQLAKRIDAAFVRGVARRTVDLVIAPSDYLASRLRARGFEAVDLVQLFTEVGSEPATLPSASEEVFFGGRLGFDKGVHLLIEAFNTIAERFPAARLSLAGDGPDRRRLEALASPLGSRVRFLGALPNAELRAAMGRARLIVIPSLKQEGAPIVAIEAALAGRPVVVSDDPGLRELVENGAYGRVVPRSDVTHLATAIADLLGDPRACDEMGARARLTALSTWTTEPGVARIRHAYEHARELCARRSPSRAR
jgi:glycosyltransferase involved in cell wall biosynthesis